MEQVGIVVVHLGIDVEGYEGCLAHTLLCAQYNLVG